jgi:hypothetical protein
MHALSDVEMVRTVTVAPSEVARVITHNAPIPNWLCGFDGISSVAFWSSTGSMGAYAWCWDLVRR